MNDSEAIEAGLAAARQLTYNDPVQGQAKHMLHELAHRLGRKTVQVRMKSGRPAVVTAYGQARYLTVLERLRYRIWGSVPSI